MSYRIALERLLAFEPKRLLRGPYWDGSCGCFVGIVCPEMRRPDLYLSRPFGWVLREVGMTMAEADYAIQINDTFEGTEEQRYQYMLAFCQSRIAAEEQANG